MIKSYDLFLAAREFCQRCAIASTDQTQTLESTPFREVHQVQ